MKIHTAVVSGLSLMMFIAGCSTNAAVNDDDFGDSVRHMVQQQTYNPGAESQTGALPKGGLMGDKAAAAVKAYRAGAQPTAASDSITSVAMPSGTAAPTNSR
jgi:hypothetical protein